MPFTQLIASESDYRQAIIETYLLPEKEAVEQLLTDIHYEDALFAQSQAFARRLVMQIRKKRTRTRGIDTLMQEYHLSSNEGIALMCLAEALLRIPDQHTTDRLISECIQRGNWQQHLWHSPSIFVNAMTWGMVITKKLTTPPRHATLAKALKRVLRKSSAPLIRKGMKFAIHILGKRFVCAETITAALTNNIPQVEKGYRYSYDMLGESAMTREDADHYLAAYEMAIHGIGRYDKKLLLRDRASISIKLSALYPRFEPSQRDNAVEALSVRVKKLAALCKHYRIGLHIDAEESNRLDLTLDLIALLAHDPTLQGWEGMGIVIQAYQKRASALVDYVIGLARRTNHMFMVRLVKGAYWDSEIKQAQVQGLKDYPVFTRKAHTDLSYLVCAQKLLTAQEVIFPQFATHNALTVAGIYTMGQGKNYEFQCLYGMGETLYDQLLQLPYQLPCRIYAPVGIYRDLVPYLIRRLLENGANNAFVNRQLNTQITFDSLLADPVQLARGYAGSVNPYIHLPEKLYGAARQNAPGLSLADTPALTALQAKLATRAKTRWQAMPVLAADSLLHTDRHPVLNPADTHDIVGEVQDATAADVEAAITAAQQMFPAWANESAAKRADLLDAIAAQYIKAQDQLLSLLIREAGRTLPDALAEIREAMDFCYYYAAQIRSDANLNQPLGILVAISPWNFPLAIFTGQIVSALATGNVVLAKPAAQTPCIATLATRLMHQAGIPAAALQLLPGPGSRIGHLLTSDPRISGVLFTGSLETAHAIERTLAQHPQECIFIAETSGLNAMIVDSSALTEQVVHDVMYSAFNSAGQRCSALRILYLQEEIAQKTLSMLQGAMLQWQIGEPHQLNADMGPVIDAQAKSQLEQHIERLRQHSPFFFQPPLPDNLAGNFIAPTLCEVSSILDIPQEIFGPVLHVARFRAGGLSTVIREINQAGYGLTLGLHSRILHHHSLVIDNARTGNIYINRNMIGAVVGVQPFGGEGLSGTGPKAGGLWYLYRLTHATPGFSPETAHSSHRQAMQQAIAALIPAQEQADMLAAIAPYAIAFPEAVHLVGPTGEENFLRYAPRGKVACLAPTFAQRLIQIAAALACHNQIVLEDTAENRTLEPFFGTSIEYAHDPLHTVLNAILYAGENYTQLAQAVARRPGVIIPIIQARPHYPLYRLLNEHAVCINTTAAGGNVSLLSRHL